jgi:hypothetical protein
MSKNKKIQTQPPSEVHPDTERLDWLEGRLPSGHYNYDLICPQHDTPLREVIDKKRAQQAEAASVRAAEKRTEDKAVTAVIEYVKRHPHPTHEQIRAVREMMKKLPNRAADIMFNASMHKWVQSNKDEILKAFKVEVKVQP